MALYKSFIIMIIIFYDTYLLIIIIIIIIIIAARLPERQLNGRTNIWHILRQLIACHVKQYCMYFA